MPRGRSSDAVRASMPTMRDIAQRVGVNQATVSNVLNGRFAAKRSDAARRAARIRRVAAQMGYRVSAAARATRTGRTGFIGMIRSPLLACSVHAIDFDTGVDEALHAKGLCLLRDTIDDPRGSNGTDAVPPRIVRENAVDGLLINYAFGTPPAVRDLIDRCRIPAIWINRKRESNCVRPDDDGAAYEATRYLLEHGHVDIALLSNDRPLNDLAYTEAHYSVADRRAGYTRAMAEAGVEPRYEALDITQPHGYDPGCHVSACVRWLGRPGRPTAVLCANPLGRAMVAAAWQLQLCVPRDLSVMTFDNAASADYDIAVDRMLVRYRAMGYAAVREICALVNQPDTSRQSVVIPFEMHRTGTVARPTRHG